MAMREKYDRLRVSVAFEKQDWAGVREGLEAELRSGRAGRGVDGESCAGLWNVDKEGAEE